MIWGHRTIAKLLIENKANMNAEGGCYGNALEAASFRGWKAIVKFLVENGADVNVQEGYCGNTLEAA